MKKQVNPKPDLFFSMIPITAISNQLLIEKVEV